MNKKSLPQSFEIVCLVCGSSTKCLHYQVLSCRACAGFYKRAVILNRIYQCLNGTKNCDLIQRKNAGLPLCKYCRLQKCKEIGMALHENTIKVLQSISQNKVSIFYNQLITCPSIPRIEGVHLIYDSNPLIETIKYILNEQVSSNPQFQNHSQSFLSQIKSAFTAFQTKVSIIPNTPIRTLDRCDLEIFNFCEHYLINLAYMLMECKTFAGLPFYDKYSIFIKFWLRFNGIERMFASIKFFGPSNNDNRILMSNKFAIDTSNMVAMQGQAVEKLKPYMNPLTTVITKNIFQPLKSMQITEFELIYLSSYMLWTVHDLPHLSPSTYQLADQIFEQSAVELHDYYTSEMKLHNYAPRFAKLSKIIAAIEKAMVIRREYSTLVKVFDMFNCDFCDSELMNS